MQRQKEEEATTKSGDQHQPLHEYEIRERYYRPSFLPPAGSGGSGPPPGLSPAAGAYWQYPAFGVELRSPFEAASAAVPANFYPAAHTASSQPPQPPNPHDIRTIPPNLPKPFRAELPPQPRPSRPPEQPPTASVATWRPVEPHQPQPQQHSHFQLGSLIQLANGDLKRVENLSTEDFLRSAKSSTEVKIDQSVVTSLDLHSDRGVASIAFSVGHEKVQVSKNVLLRARFFSFTLFTLGAKIQIILC